MHQDDILHPQSLCLGLRGMAESSLRGVCLGVIQCISFEMLDLISTNPLLC